MIIPLHLPPSILLSLPCVRLLLRRSGVDSGEIRETKHTEGDIKRRCESERREGEKIEQEGEQKLRK